MKTNELKYTQLDAAHLQKMYDLTRQMSSLNDEAHMLQILLDELMQETNAEVGAFIYYDSQSDRFEARTIRTPHGSSDSSVEFSTTVFRQVLDTKEAVLSFDTQNDAAYQDARSVIMNDIHAILAFPLIINAQVYGILYFDSRRNRQSFNEMTRQFLSFFAVIASLALEQVLKKERVEKENIALHNQLQQSPQLPEMIGRDPLMQNLFRLVHKVSQTDVPVIISGENGTGKDLVAQAIHKLSKRKDRPFIAQYIGNIPTSIVESELFGYKKGAFTGASSNKTGLFEAADGGTLFLDEIGDLHPDLQVKLLRVLQNHEIKRLGENTVRKVDVRIVTATNRDLARMVKEGTFREDLYYRLNVININVPPLRKRSSDIPLLASHFLKDTGLELSREALSKLMQYRWPGNVRQLDNILKRATILASGQRIEADDIQLDSEDALPDDTILAGTMEEIKNRVIKQRIEECNGNKTHAAKSLNISLRSLQAKAKELGL